MKSSHEAIWGTSDGKLSQKFKLVWIRDASRRDQHWVPLTRFWSKNDQFTWWTWPATRLSSRVPTLNHSPWICFSVIYYWLFHLPWEFKITGFNCTFLAFQFCLFYYPWQYIIKNFTTAVAKFTAHPQVNFSWSSKESSLHVRFLWLFDRQPVKVLNWLNDQQWDFFMKTM